MHVHKLKIGRAVVVGLAMILLLITSAGSALADTSANSQAASKALAWMHTQQQPDGSFAGFGAGSTVDALLAIVASGQDPASFTQGINTPITFLQSNAGSLAKTAGGAGKLLIAVHALGMDPKSFGGADLIGAVQATYGISATGQYGASTIDSAFAILGLHAAGQPVPAEAVQRLESLQASNGGWSFSGDTADKAADTNTTSVVLQALVAEGADKTNGLVIKHAVIYLVDQQNKVSGWPYQQGGDFGSDSDVNSTSYVVQSMLSLQNLTIAEAGQQFILSMQNKSGAFAYQKSQPDDNAGATYQAIPALLGATFLNPIPVPVAAPPVTPGMPTTGDGVEPTLAAFGLLVALAGVGAGLAARHRAIAR